MVDCTVPAESKCESVNTTICFGNKLSHAYTSFDLVTDASSLSEAEEKLLLWSGLRSVPRCWDVIQPLLCALYLPKCENRTVHLPDRSLCMDTRSPCRIVEIEQGWPDFLKCDNDGVYKDNCPVQQLTFNKSECEVPLIATNNPASFYRDVEGCGLQCMNPLFTEEEHVNMHKFIAASASVTIILTFFAILSFVIDWANSSKYPARIVFYINLCFNLSCFGWLAQFFGDARKEIVCRKDGTMRLEEPVGTSESPSCVIVFIIVYFFALSGISWFVVLSYAWRQMFHQLIYPNVERKEIKPRHYHLFAWAIPMALAIGSVVVSQIDGDSMSGICFIGYKNHWYRLGFLLIPVGIALIVGGYFLFSGIYSLFSIKHAAQDRLSRTNLIKINWTMIRLGLFILFAFIFVFITFAAHTYDITHQSIWERSFRDYIRCEANVTILEKLNENIIDPAATNCIIEQRPLLSVMKLHLLALFGTGVVMSTWVWTKASFLNWRRLIYKVIGRSDNEMKRIRHKSQMIAKAFANRDAIQQNDKDVLPELEFSEHTLSHGDPVGMDFDFDSISDELSKKFVKNIPKMVYRRGAIVPYENTENDDQTNDATTVPKQLYYTIGSQVWAITNSNMQHTNTTKKKIEPEEVMATQVHRNYHDNDYNADNLDNQNEDNQENHLAFSFVPQNHHTKLT